MTGPIQSPDDLGSDPIALGGGLMPGSYPYLEQKKERRLKVSVRQVNSFNEKVKIRVVIDD
jgi:hypothetical protein